MLLRRRCGLVFELVVWAAIASAQSYVVVQPVVNMYSGPTVDADVVSQAIYGSSVRLTESKPDDARQVTAEQRAKAGANWLYVRTPDDYPGWIQAVGVRKLAADEKYADNDNVLYVANLSANIYREKDVTAHAPLVTVPLESRLERIGKGADPEGGRWFRVRLPEGGSGWVQSGDVTTIKRNLTIDEGIALAKRFQGVTYTWGGTSSFGFDCSGFMQMVMRQRGILMPRDADQQATWSGLAPVKREELKAGDLLYFGSSPDRITHTGMYIGNGEFIHDTTNTRPMVQISRLNDQPWTRLLVACRRAKQQ